MLPRLVDNVALRRCLPARAGTLRRDNFERKIPSPDAALGDGDGAARRSLPINSTRAEAAAEAAGARSGAGEMAFVAAFAIAIHFALGRSWSATRLRAATLRT